jgi:hypothetical protein
MAHSDSTEPERDPRVQSNVPVPAIWLRTIDQVESGGVDRAPPSGL